MERDYSFGHLLRRRRKALDLTQESLADGVHCSCAAIRKIEADERRPSRRLAERLADRLEVTAAERAEFLMAARGIYASDNYSPGAASVSGSQLTESPETLSRGLPTALDHIPFVGRVRELQQLCKLLEQTKSGSGYVVLIEGEAGIGKTRLLQELSQQARSRGIPTLRANCYEIEQGMPYQPVIELVEKAVEQSLPLLKARMSPIALAEIASLVPELASRVPDLPQLSNDLPEARQVRLFHAIAHVFEVVAAGNSLLVVVEDLHWIDNASLQFLHYFARHLLNWRILFLLSYRSEEAATEVRLTALLASIRREPHAYSVLPHRLSVGEMRDLLAATQENGGIGFLFDVHGTRVIEEDPADLYLGTDNGTTIARLLSVDPQALWRRRGIRGYLGLDAAGYVISPQQPDVEENKEVDGGHTVRTYGSSAFNGIDAMQLEIASTLRNDKDKRCALIENLAFAIGNMAARYLDIRASSAFQDALAISH